MKYVENPSLNGQGRGGRIIALQFKIIRYNMATDEVFYTDGQDIVVTLSTLQVKGRRYSLASIRKHGLAILQPARLPGIILFVAGVVLTVCGMANLFPTNAENFLLQGKVVNANVIGQWAGTVLTVIGLAITIALRERYAVRIATEDGEKNAIVSTRREYIAEIVDALNRAFMMIDVHRSVARSRF